MIPFSGDLGGHEMRRPCVVKNTFLHIVYDGNLDSMCDSPNHRRQTSEPPVRSRDLARHRQQYFSGCQGVPLPQEGGLAAPPRDGLLGGCVEPVHCHEDCDSDDMNKVELSVTGCGAASQLSTRQPSSSSTSTRQISTDVPSTDNEEHALDVQNHQQQQPPWRGPHAADAQAAAASGAPAPGGRCGGGGGGGLPKGRGAGGGLLRDRELHQYKDIVEEAEEPEASAPEGRWPSQQQQQQGSWRADQKRRSAHVDPMPWSAGVVTVMVRQIPRQHTQLMFLKEVIRRGFAGLFDFLYLPYDLKKSINVGYGFINFLDPQLALDFKKEFDSSFLDKHMKVRGKPLRVHPASVQGYDANYKHFVQTKTGQKQDPSFSPLFFPGGVMPEGALKAWQRSMNLPQQQQQPQSPQQEPLRALPSAAGSQEVSQEVTEEMQTTWCQSNSSECAETQSAMLICQLCQSPYRKEHKFCASCGNLLGQELQQFQRPAPEEFASLFHELEGVKNQLSKELAQVEAEESKISARCRPQGRH